MSFARKPGTEPWTTSMPKVMNETLDGKRSGWVAIMCGCLLIEILKEWSSKCVRFKCCFSMSWGQLSLMSSKSGNMRRASSNNIGLFSCWGASDQGVSHRFRPFSLDLLNLDNLDMPFYVIIYSEHGMYLNIYKWGRIHYQVIVCYSWHAYGWWCLPPLQGQYVGFGLCHRGLCRRVRAPSPRTGELHATVPKGKLPIFLGLFEVIFYFPNGKSTTTGESIKWMFF